MMEGLKDGVRSSIASCLTRVLGSEERARKMAEEELKTLEVTQGHVMYFSFLYMRSGILPCLHSDRVCIWVHVGWTRAWWVMHCRVWFAHINGHSHSLRAEYGVVLAEMTASEDSPVQYRQV